MRSSRTERSQRFSSWRSTTPSSTTRGISKRGHREATAITTADRLTVVDSGPLVGTVTVDRSFGDSTASVTYSLRAGSPRLDIHIDIDWHEHEHLLSMAFPLDVRADMATCDVQFGSVRRPTHPTTSWDAAKFEVCAHRYVDIAEPGFGVAILNNGRYGHGVFDGQVRVSLLRAARYPDPDADQGRHTVDLAVYPHGSGLADVVREAEHFNTPVRAVIGSATAAPPPVVSLTGAGVEIDAVKLADDGEGDLVVRLHEACGDRRHVMLRADRRILAASRCNLLEEPFAGLEVGDGIAVLTVRPFELVTLRLTRDAQPWITHPTGDAEPSRRTARCHRSARPRRTRPGSSGWREPSADRDRAASRRGTSSSPAPSAAHS